MSKGNCFEVAARIVSGFGTKQVDGSDKDDVQRGLDYIEAIQLTPSQEVKKLELVHGVVERQSDKLLHLHAWVEVTMTGGIFGEERVMCLDTSNGREYWMPQDTYYNAGVCLTTSYTPEKVLEQLAMDDATWGPWHLSEPTKANERRAALWDDEAMGHEQEADAATEEYIARNFNESGRLM